MRAALVVLVLLAVLAAGCSLISIDLTPRLRPRIW